jgi:ABC-type oligopeptide transport system ATPase subunit
MEKLSTLNKNRTIQVVGISGSGKSFLLNTYFDTYSPKNIELFEFGTRLREKAINENRKIQKKDIYELVDEITASNKPLIITSHMVYRKSDGSYTWDFEFDRLMASVAYVYINTEPARIFSQIMTDTSLKGTLRKDSPNVSMDVDTIAKHQELALQKTVEVCSLLRTDLLMLHNEPSLLQKNLEILNAYFNTYATELPSKRNYKSIRVNKGDEGDVKERPVDLTKHLRRDYDKTDRKSNVKLEFEQSFLQSLFTREEFNLFKNIVRETASEFPDIKGVLITGSLVKQIYLPDCIQKPQGKGLQRAYQEIIFRYGRKYFPHPKSDLDMWLLIDDIQTCKIAEYLDSCTVDLLKWYASQKSPDFSEWIDKKHKYYDPYYKKSYLYPESWNRDNIMPYLGSSFKEILVSNINNRLKTVRNRIENFFLKNYPDDFLEVRAYPSSVFNLRPEPLILSNGRVDRTPFAYYLKDWLDLEKNCMVLYRRDNMSPTIYPFDKNGVIRGQRIADFINWYPKGSA